MIEIDGSYGSGGGQIIRTAVGLSAVTEKPCRIFNIRRGRTIPGLKAQHMKGIEAVSRLCNADVSGLKIGSCEIVFYPREIEYKHLSIDIGTAGAITLVLQSLMIPAIHTDKKLVFEITGGTDVAWSPSMIYFQEVFSRFLKKMGVEINTEILRYGFYPKGGGKVRITVKPCKKLKPLKLIEQGKLKRTDIWSIASKSLERVKVAERQIIGAKNIFKKFEGEFFDYVESLSTGSSFHLHSHFENTILGATALGKPGIPAEKIGELGAKLLQKQIDSGACLDEWMADQILPYIALVNEKSVITVSKLSSHAETNIWVIKKFLPVEFKIKKQEKNVRIECSGVKC
jgi:RNA 3'-phosphate cyclase